MTKRSIKAVEEQLTDITDLLDYINADSLDNPQGNALNRAKNKLADMLANIRSLGSGFSKETRGPDSPVSKSMFTMGDYEEWLMSKENED